MDREEGSPTPAEDAATPTEGAEHAEGAEGPDEAPAGSPEHSGSRWEPHPDGGADTPVTESTATPAAGTTWWHHDVPAAPVRPRRRGLRVAAGVGAAVLLAGGGFAVGHAVGDSGPDGSPAPGIGHHRGHDHDGRGGPRLPGQTGQTGQGNQTGPTGGQTGQNTSGGPSPIVGGLFT
jgi:hypothetical protein